MGDQWHQDLDQFSPQEQWPRHPQRLTQVLEKQKRTFKQDGGFFFILDNVKVYCNVNDAYVNDEF